MDAIFVIISDLVQSEKFFQLAIYSKQEHFHVYLVTGWNFWLDSSREETQAQRSLKLH